MFKLLLISFFVLTASSKISDEDLAKKNELKDTVEEKVEMIMSQVDKRCDAIIHAGAGKRQKRQSGDQIRDLLKDALQECQKEQAAGKDPNSTPSPPTSTTTPSSVLQSGINGPCTSMSTANLTGSWRKDRLGSHLKPANGFYACDRELSRGTEWFRFTGSAGSQLADSCAPAYSCGGHGGFWSNAVMPSVVGQIRRVAIFGSWNGNCNWYTWASTTQLLVQRCSARQGDFIYRAYGTGSCYWTFCGMD